MLAQRLESNIHAGMTTPASCHRANVDLFAAASLAVVHRNLGTSSGVPSIVHLLLEMRYGQNDLVLAVGRKNWLFVGSDNGAKWNATFVSLIASCQQHKLEPWAYLRDLFCLVSDWPASRWLFCGSDDHATSTAALYSSIASARLHRLAPEEYLRCIIRLVPLWPEHRMLEPVALGANTRMA
jgi:hypothetical protein